MARDDGGAAFPLPAHSVDMGEYIARNNGESGMTLRDYFAAKAMQALIMRGSFDGEQENRSRHAYACADAMLAERAK